MPRSGQIVKRENGKYLARVYVGKDVNGKRHLVSRTFDKKKDAEAWLAEQLAAKAAGTFQAPSKETLAVYLRRWLTETVAFRVRERTLDDYTRLAEKYIIPHLGHIKTSELRADHVQKFYNTLFANNGVDTPRHVHCVLHSALNQAVKWGLVSRNVSDLVDVPRAPRREMRPLNPNEVQRFFEAARDDRYYAYFVLLVDAGLRPGEALALTWDDIDLKSGVVHVTKAISTGKSKRYFGEPKTRKSRRSVHITDGTVATLRAHKARQAEERIKVAEYWDDKNLVFPNELGDYSDGTKISKRHFKPILRKAGLPETIRVYDLRHTSATLLMAGNVHPKIVAERLGHSTTNLTLDTYSHVVPGMQEQVLQVMGTLLGSQKAHENN
ncbi:site-specific integrase [Alicyclobacillus fastidiosus]|uniref:Site-specific integrase n=1 Tax=Alicyclobacillus fastidiosus TaxID=392011 RepID=A0ABY6ZPI5_9BACL|nr:tyrosine-type recombinase/integrase [Alicyclobacillus fastidiosus]WAH44061.1 site-specific integrase [Alicyclobacillus fastidiosus]GMA60348.1 site-specific integrase [Alicyclobacillus fastidiosus]